MQYFLVTFTRFQRAGLVFLTVWLVGSSILLYRM
jgi:hypothetical protein